MMSEYSRFQVWIRFEGGRMERYSVYKLKTAALKKIAHLRRCGLDAVLLEVWCLGA